MSLSPPGGEGQGEGDPRLVELHGVDRLARNVPGLLQALLELPIQHLPLGLLGLDLLLEALLAPGGAALERGQRLVQSQSRARPRGRLVGDHGLEAGIDREPTIAARARHDERRHGPYATRKPAACDRSASRRPRGAGAPRSEASDPETRAAGRRGRRASRSTAGGWAPACAASNPMGPRRPRRAMGRWLTPPLGSPPVADPRVAWARSQREVLPADRFVVAELARRAVIADLPLLEDVDAVGQLETEAD